MYHRYVDDTFLTFDGCFRQLDMLISFLNKLKLNPKLKFTKDVNQLKNLNFLDLTVVKSYDKLEYNLYSKPMI